MFDDYARSRVESFQGVEIDWNGVSNGVFVLGVWQIIGACCLGNSTENQNKSRDYYIASVPNCLFLAAIADNLLLSAIFLLGESRL